MIKHDELKHIINIIYPDAVHGVDFWVAHTVADGSGDQVGQAFVAVWNIEGAEKPDEVMINMFEDVYASEIEELRAAEAYRIKTPNISPRQLWLMALDIGVTKDSILAMLSEMEDQAEAAKIIIELTEPPMKGYERSSPVVETLRILQDIPKDQFDDLWSWAAGR